MRFVLRRLGFFVITLWAAITLNFLIPRLMPGNPALAMMARYRGHINPQALHALEIAFGVHEPPEPAQRVLHLPRQHLPRAVRGLAHLLPRRGEPRRPPGAALDARPRGSDHDPRLHARHVHRPPLGVEARRVARRRPAADLRHHLGVPVLLPRDARDLALRRSSSAGCRRAVATASRPRRAGRGTSPTTRSSTRSCRR